MHIVQGQSQPITELHKVFSYLSLISSCIDQTFTFSQISTLNLKREVRKEDKRQPRNTTTGDPSLISLPLFINGAIFTFSLPMY